MQRILQIAKSALSVDQVSRMVTERLQSDDRLRDIWVRGEVSNFRQPASSTHAYFTLRGRDANLECAWFDFARLPQDLREELREGSEVFARGSIRTYEKRSTYQLRVVEVVSVGRGALYEELEKLKKKLEREGLFERKSAPIPHYLTTVGVVTSLAADALRDIIKTFRRRAPWVRLIIFPCQVQGTDAPPTIIRALRQADQLEEVQVIILARGGGSLEDLWCFNDEKLARALAEIKKPVITGVGHETDTTLVDLVADQRAPTPTAAAELASRPTRDELVQRMGDYRSRLLRAAQRQLRRVEERWEMLARTAVALRIIGRIRQLEDLLERAGRSLARAAHRRTTGRLDELERHFQQLVSYQVVGRIEDGQIRLDEIAAALPRLVWRRLERAGERLEDKGRHLQALSPRHTLERGYLIARDRLGRVVSRARKLSPGDELSLTFYDGSALTEVREVSLDGEGEKKREES